MELGRASVSGPPVRLAEKIAPGTRACESLDIITNVWGLIPRQNIPVYRYDFRVLEEYPPKKGSNEPAIKEVTKQTRNDYLSVDRKTKCLAIYQTLLKQQKQFFGDMYSLIYDRASILYSLRKLPISEASGDQERRAEFFLKPNELPKDTVADNCVQVHVYVKPCKEDFQLTMNDLKSGVSNDPDKINRSLQQFLEILAMQEVFFMQGRFVSFGSGETYLMDPSQFGFSERDMPELEGGKYIAIGASKGVRIIEGPQEGGINAAMVIDVKKAAFHADNQDLLEKVECLLRKDRSDLKRGVDQQSIAILNKALKGLYVLCNYGKKRAFTVTGVSKENARTSKLVTKSGEMSVEKYFEMKYSMKLKYPTLPLIMERSQPKNNFYPIEVLSVCENQRVSKGQQTSSQVQTMIRACATVPSLRLQQTNALSKAMKLDATGENKWMKNCSVVVTNNLMFPARVLPSPDIEYRINGWVKPRHMKYIESKEQVVTQDLKATTAVAVAVQNKRQTLENIVNKTNIKLGGLNYSVHLETNCDKWLTKAGFLVVGLDIAHPAVSMVSRKDRNFVPSVIGYSANIKKHPLDFIGGYRYCKAEMEELVDDTMQEVFSYILRYYKASRGEPPNHLFVIRDGVSAGQYKYVMNTEVQQIKKACQMVGGPNFCPHITFIVLTKMHNVRLYKKNIHKQERPAEQNIKPGTIIDKHVVNPVLNEFYLNSHLAFQGTTKIPRYTLLFDTSKMKADVMQGIVHALAYNFQIVNMAVSCPSPVMIADRMAKRGRCNYVAMFGDESENSDNGSGIEKDLIQLNNQLSYISKPLETVRFNA
ncbi:hypothetical protein X798_06925 [Onchocerca flexuosa]|uniref:Piwi domain protein n=2 Tax=Onchocerca flexuosa TaxID=387005 RepID=A0A238BLK5_9BILA|nr:hypothetical protein X798_06925 [Onchocerca flexuosa]